MAKKKTTKPNNDTLAAEAIETHENESILNEPDPPDRGADEIEMDCGEMSVEEPMEIIKETDKTPQRMAKKIPRDEQIKLGKRPFEFENRIEGYEGGKRNFVQAIIPKEIREALNQLQERMNKMEEEKKKDSEEAKKQQDQADKKVKDLEDLVGNMVKKMTAWKQELDVFNKRSTEAKIFSESARDQAAQVGTKVVEVEERTEEAHRLIEEIDNGMKRFNKQQMDFSEARAKLAEKELNTKFQGQFAEVKYSEKQAKLAIRKVEELSRKVTSNTNICQETQKELKRTKFEARSATSLPKAKENPWKIQGPPKSRVRINQVRAEQAKTAKKAESEEYRVFIRVPDTQAQEDISKLGAKIDEIHGKGTVKFGSRTRSGHIKFFITKKEVADTAEKWIQNVGPNYTTLETEDWCKGVIYRVPKEWSPENLRKEIEESNGIDLKVDPKLMKENPDGNTFLLCFDNAEHYFKCERGVLLQYQRLPMKMYHKRSDEEFKAYKLRKAKAEAEKAKVDEGNAKTDESKAEADSTAEAEKPDDNVAPNDNTNNNDN